ncbi:glycoside hydrolase family 76 protein [Aspergillus clavatus NRRL 1]|uniref:Mannan endo-1,6-alpha-mannosidase n=1 Tax=Aspergillus clavatus (strain ATCC 1007 / CBS 513.65 / DSM 816 / NCTC 3887 / NRRL 1 / QM 1276 / 107) TaxID=344612 RepID=A1CCV1_ASPCL|nr:glycosyl hydrolase, putative [Aspergillus clavatus NRRL 1]EAW12358.1 glycosyl hydrolase, putative [Aspergillus clavatus NRRL 1]
MLSPHALTLQEHVKQVANRLAWDLVSFYTGNETGDVPGNLPEPYYWWEAGAFFGTLINYWRYTGNDTYNDITTEAILQQAGAIGNFMPANQMHTEGNDDQAFWAITALMAAENNFPNPPKDSPSWLAMAQAVFNEQAGRWDDQICGGGLKWQIFPFNNGYTYRNAISNGCFFNIAARLARYTGEVMYAEWANKVWDWVMDVGLINSQYHVLDGLNEGDNCSEPNRVEWTYNNGVFLHGAAHMWNHSKGDWKWKIRIDGLLDAQKLFLSPNKSSSGILHEYACETINTCQTDEFSFKAYLARWMGDVAQLAPWTRDTIATRLLASATAAAAQCVGGETGTYCGMRWTTGEYDGTTGVGQQMSALEVVQATLFDTVAGPLTNRTGGTSRGNGATGTERGSSDQPAWLGELSVITRTDRVVANFATAVVGMLVGGYLYLVST